MSSSTLLLSSLSKYFTEHKKDALVLQQLVEGTYPVSLRVIDWFVTHYSKLKNIIYWIDDSKGTLLEGMPTQFTPNIRKFHLYYEYRAQLKSYTKLYFDPFRRHNRISFVIQSSPHIAIETTLGQLNFFRWAIHNHILDYVRIHLTEIEESMTQYQVQRKKRTETKHAMIVNENVTGNGNDSNKLKLNKKDKDKEREKEKEKDKIKNAEKDVILHKKRIDKEKELKKRQPTNYSVYFD